MKVGALDVADDVVLHVLVLVKIENANCLLPVRLNQIMPIAELIGLVDESNPCGLLQGVEKVAAKAENGVGHVKRRQDACANVGLLGHFVGAVWRDFAWIVKCNRDGIHAPNAIEGVVVMFGVGVVGGDDEQGVTIPFFRGCGLEEIAKGVVGVIDGLFKAAPVVNV